jgi:hypothetical protein
MFFGAEGLKQIFLIRQVQQRRWIRTNSCPEIKLLWWHSTRPIVDHAIDRQCQLKMDVRTPSAIFI